MTPLAGCLPFFATFGLIVGPYSHARSSNDDSVSKIMNSIEKRFSSSRLAKKYSHLNNATIRNEDIYFAETKYAKVMTLVAPETIIEILKNGEFMNQHQVGDSGGGGYNPRKRFSIEQNMAGIDLKGLSVNKEELKRILPKYGMVEFHDFARDRNIHEQWEDFPKSEELHNFGEIAIYFKDSIKKRTSIVSQDSGNLGEVDNISEYVQSLRQRNVIIDWEQATSGEFFEAQIWGPVTLKDIDYVVLPTGLMFEGKVSLKDVARALGSAGIRTYRERRARSETENRMEDLRILLNSAPPVQVPLAKPSKKCSELLSLQRLSNLYP